MRRRRQLRKSRRNTSSHAQRCNAFCAWHRRSGLAPEAGGLDRLSDEEPQANIIVAGHEIHDRGGPGGTRKWRRRVGVRWIEGTSRFSKNEIASRPRRHAHEVRKGVVSASGHVMCRVARKLCPRLRIPGRGHGLAECPSNPLNRQLDILGFYESTVPDIDGYRVAVDLDGVLGCVPGGKRAAIPVEGHGHLAAVVWGNAGEVGTTVRDEHVHVRWL